MATEIPVFVPYRSDNDQRDRNWMYANAILWDTIDWAKIILGESPGGPFNISAARNDAARKVDWDVAIFADADSLVSEDTLGAAVAEARESQQPVLPHSRWVNVRQDEVHPLLERGWIPFDPKRTVVSGTKGSVIVLPRAAYDAVNGFDERFQGWGWEDTAFYHAVTHLYSPVIQFEGSVLHLDHERPDEDLNRGTNENAIRNRHHYGRYTRARNETELRSLILGNRVTL